MVLTQPYSFPKKQKVTIRLWPSAALVLFVMSVLLSTSTSGQESGAGQPDGSASALELNVTATSGFKEETTKL